MCPVTPASDSGTPLTQAPNEQVQKIGGHLVLSDIKL